MKTELGYFISGENALLGELLVGTLRTLNQNLDSDILLDMYFAVKYLDYMQ